MVSLPDIVRELLLQILPTPRYFVFYNGRDNAPEKEVLRLTDAFSEPDKSSIEVTVTVYNINAGNNCELMEKCRTLSEYSTFVERVRRYQAQETDIQTAVNAAVDSCIRDGILTDFLVRNKAEVMDVVLTEYDEAKHMKLIEKEAEAIGQIKGAVKLARSTPDISDQEIVSKIVDLFGLSENEAWEYVRNYD